MKSRLVRHPLTWIAALSIAAPIVSGACSSDSSGGSTPTPGKGGAGGNDASAGSGGSAGTTQGGGAGTAQGGGAGTTQGGGAGTSQGGASGEGGAAGSGEGGSAGGVDAGPTSATIQDITTGAVGVGTNVNVTGVVAVSPVFLVSQSKSTGSCLWGVFVSAPGLTETAANSGIMVVSYGTNATIPDGGTKAYCPTIGTPLGAGIPDNAAPGDVFDVVGEADNYKPSTCGNNAGDTTFGQFQISNATLTKTGTAAVPTPHVLSASDVTQLVSGAAGDKAFHDQWGGVMVTVQNMTAVPQTGGDAGATITNQYGEMTLTPGNLIVGDKIYYRGYAKAADACYAGPAYANASTTFTSISGLVYLNYCTWGLQPVSKCKDLNPASDDCNIGGSDPTTQCTHY